MASRALREGTPLLIAPAPGSRSPVHVMRQAAYVLRFVWSHPSNRSRRIRSVARAVRFQAGARILRRGSVIVPIGRRSRLRVLPHVYSSTKALYANPPDWPEMLVWSRSLRPGDLFVDVGANVGVYSVWAADLGAHVIAVEPNGLAADRLRDNAELNGYVIEIARVALSDEPGTVSFTTELDMSNHLVSGAAGGVAVETVPATTLDSLLGDRVAAGVKIDVEGAESLVLRGAARALAERRIRLLQIEWNDCSRRLLGRGRDEIAALLHAHGYELCLPDGSGVLEPSGVPGEGSDVFARPVEGTP